MRNCNNVEADLGGFGANAKKQIKRELVGTYLEQLFGRRILRTIAQDAWFRVFPWVLVYIAEALRYITCVVLALTIWSITVLCCVVLLCVLCRVACTQCFTVSHSIALCSTLLHSVALCCTVLPCVALCCTVLHCVSLCLTVFHCVALLRWTLTPSCGEIQPPQGSPSCSQHFPHFSNFFLISVHCTLFFKINF